MKDRYPWCGQRVEYSSKIENRSEDSMLHLNVIIGQFAMQTVLSREDGHVFRVALNFNVEFQRMIERPKRT